MLVQSGEFNGAPLPAKLDVGSLRCNCGQKLRHYYKDIYSSITYAPQYTTLVGSIGFGSPLM